MHLKITLLANKIGEILPLNYQYPLSSAIYKIISQADEEYAVFLHEQGYQKKDSQKTYRLFSFSAINTPFTIRGDRMMMKTNKASIIVCFHIPEAATNFLKGLFANQIVDIADKKSKATFTVSQVELLSFWDTPVQSNTIKQVVLNPISPMVIGITNEKGNYDFLSPVDERFIPALLHHWKEKYRVFYGDEAMADFDTIQIEVLNADKAKSRLLAIKAGMPQETKIRGFVGFQLKIRTKWEIIELMLNSGSGVYNSMGMGCVEMV